MTGFPDWLVPVNISRQELAEITNRPKYGAAQEANLFRVILAGNDFDLVSITSLGKTYGGFIFVTSDSDPGEDVLKITVDGVDVTLASFNTLFQFETVKTNMFYVRLVKVDKVNFVYVISIQGDLTFEESFVINYRNAHSDTVLITGSLMFTVI